MITPTDREDFVMLAATHQDLYALDRLGRVWRYQPAANGYKAAWTLLTDRRSGTKWFASLKQQPPVCAEPAVTEAK
jgi:hypothetical protein